MTIRNLERLFHPRDVVVIGASAKPQSLGHSVFSSLRSGGFKGAVVPVNPKGGMIGDTPVARTIAELGATPDLAVIASPPDTVAGIIAELGAKGCRAGVVLTAGFGEGGSAAGTQRREAVLAAARPNLFRIIGPNCLGVLVPGISLNASFVRTPALPGSLALIAQSGAIASALLDWARARGIGFSHVVTLGDMIDVDFGDMLDYLAEDSNTRAILLYVEGITQARKFMSAARRAARIKPVLAVKGGRHKASAKVATSHTGALAGSDAVYDAVFARAGVMRVDDLDDLFAAAELLTSQKAVAGDRLAIVTNGGGLGVLAADRLLSAHGRLAELSAATVEALNRTLPATWSGGNPIDVIGDAGAQRYGAAVKAAIADAGCDAVLVMHCPTLSVEPECIAEVIADAAATADKPLIAAFTGKASLGAARDVLARHRIATFSTPRQAVNAFVDLVRYRQHMDLLMETPAPAVDAAPTAVAQARALLATETEGRWLSADRVRQLLELYGIPCNRTASASTPDGAAQIARDWCVPVALKIDSADIVHKSDVGGVRLDVPPQQVAVAARDLLETVRRHVPQARIDGLRVEEMVRRPHAHELFLGMTLDAVFGPVIAVGNGGIGIEVIDDKAFGLPPLNANLARAMIGQTRIGRLLVGYRNRPAADEKAVAQALVALSQLVSDHPQIVDLDINPLLADEHGIIAVDARIRVDPAMALGRLIVTPYPRELETCLERIGGPPLYVRPIRPQDEPLVIDFARQLCLEDLRFRFFVPLREVDHRQAAGLTQIDYDREMVLIGCSSPRYDAIETMAQFHADPDNIQAEFAIAVRSDRQGQGLAFTLMTYLIELARRRGLHRIWGAVLRSNNRMLALAKHLGMRVCDGEDPGTVQVVLELHT